MSKKKIKIAFVKFGGLSAGGTERFIQNIAVSLPKDRFEIDFYYCDSAPYVGSNWVHPDTDPNRKKFMEDAEINLIKFNVAAKDVTKPHHPWLETNFFELFDETKYDIIQTGRAGHPEYPFTEINETSIVDSLHLPGQVDHKSNVIKEMHVSKWQANTRIQAGAKPEKIEIVPSPILMKPRDGENLRMNLGIPDDDFVFGFHQRADDEIFAPHSLMAYKSIMNEKTHFVILGGSEKYAQFAQEHGLKNFRKLPHTSNQGGEETRNKFLETLDVFAHSRADGETGGLSMIEALYFGLPIIGHVAPAMGHEEMMGDAGVVCKTLQEYIDQMAMLLNDKSYYKMRSENATTRYENEFSMEVIVKKVVGIYEDVVTYKEREEKINSASDEDFWNDVWDE